MTTAPPTSERRNLFLVANNIDETGGLQRVFHTLAAAFAARGHRVELIGVVPGPRGREIPFGEGYATTVLTRSGERGEWAPRGMRARLNVLLWLKELRRRVVHVGTVARLRARFDAVADGIVVVGQVWAMQSVADADPRHLRVVAMSHESHEASRGLVPTAADSTRYERIMRLYRPVDQALFLTRSDADRFERDGLCNVGVMHNPLPFWPEQVSALTAKTVVAIGRLEAEKRYDRLIDAWATVARRHPDWTLRIYGTGSLAEALSDQVRAGGLAGAVELMGSTTDVEAALMDASVLALSSEQEGLPLVLAEAMACGVPCVAFDCAPGIREIITDGEDGIVVRNRDVDGLAEQLCRLIEVEPLRHELGRRARSSIARFRLDAVVRDWERLFDVVER